ncbi:unnamed protein product [Dicrocoelium dendriticum]|nr:unnamed protein product [Dicrocoelium dendriticum]
MFQLPGRVPMEQRTFQFSQPDGNALTVRLCSPVIRSDVSKYGHYTWKCAEVLSEHIAKFPELVRGRRVLELGSGTGLCGLVAGMCGASFVTFTDSDPTLETYLLQSAQENGIKETVGFRLLDWEHPTHKWRPFEFDLLLASDTLFEKRGWHIRSLSNKLSISI